jgi:hypothetical protein
VVWYPPNCYRVVCAGADNRVSSSNVTTDMEGSTYVSVSYHAFGFILESCSRSGATATSRLMTMMCLTMIRIGVMALTAMFAAACSTTPTKSDTVKDSPIGEILRQHARQRSFEECKANGMSSADCSASIAKAQAHLQNVNERLEALLKDPRTNMCDLVRWTGACNNPIYTLGDLADCLQSSADRGEALNSGRFTLNVDSQGCPTDRK